MPIPSFKTKYYQILVSKPLSGYDAKTAKIPFVGFSHEYDEMCVYDNKRNYFPFVRLEKMFFPKEGSLDDRGNILHGQSLPDSFSIFSIMCARADSLVSSSAFEMV